MSGHADEAVGEQQAGGVAGSSPPIPKSTIKYSNGILLRGEGRGKVSRCLWADIGCGRKFRMRERFPEVSHRTILLPDRTSG